ncbi:MAG: cation transporter [Bacteroidales bacterium]|nr:cation transporter [Bacteroidales bacterium]MBN2755766.1 cation transporter [Bacteroidales bacterium]
MSKEKTRIKQILKVSWISVIVNALLALIKISAGIISGSMAVLADGIDSASDILTSAITLFTGKIIGKKPNFKYPYGYTRADTIAAKFLSFVIFFAGAQLAFSSIKKLFFTESIEIPSVLAIYVTLISIISKFLLAKYILAKGKKTESLMLIANAKNMQNDILISVTVLIGLLVTIYLKIPFFDSITAIFVSFWIFKVSFEIFMKTSEELMEGCSDTEIYKNVFKAVAEIKEVKNPHRVRIRKIGNLFLVELDIEVDGNLTVKDSHEIANRVEAEIKLNINNVYDVFIHVEPIGNVEVEKFGMSINDIDNI